MIHLRCDFSSEALSLSTSMTVLLPEPNTAEIGTDGPTAADPPPVLYLLHGLGDDDTVWLRQTSIERYVAPLGLAVVMPQVHRSFYSDEVYGGRFWSFLSEELPELVGSLFRVSDRREDTFVAGLSMGGYGALKWALRSPGRFAAAASLSGAVDLAGAVDRGLRTKRFLPEDPRMFERISGGEGITGTPDDLLWLLSQADSEQLPRLYACCGTEDEMIADNRRLADVCATAGVPLTTDFGPGEHDWAYWDSRIKDVLRWLPLSG